MAGALVKPNPITLNSKCSNGVLIGLESDDVNMARE